MLVRQLYHLYQWSASRLRRDLVYQEYGDAAGTPVVVLHGMAGTALTHMLPVIETLQPAYRLIAPDLRGHGKSRHLRPACDETLYSTYANDVLSLLNRLHIDDVHLIGYSDGGETAIALAAMLGERARSLSVWGVSGRVPPAPVVNVYAQPSQSIPHWEQFQAELYALHGKAAAHDLFPCWVAAMEQVAAQGGIFHDDEAARITCPTLIVTGDNDPFNPLPNVRALASHIPNIQLMVLPGAGHDLLEERRQQLLALLQRMINEADQPDQSDLSDQSGQSDQSATPLNPHGSNERVDDPTHPS